VRVLVTGASGFVGRHLVPHLAARGWEVLATDREELDVADPSAVEAAVADAVPDAVVHLAALSSLGAASSDPPRSFRVNYAGARHLLDALARRAPAARVLLVGSGEVYGALAADAPPFDEAAPLRPATLYACGKAAADLLGRTYAERGLAVVRVRPFNHSGAGQAPEFALAQFAKQLAEIEKGLREPVVRVGTLESTRDFCDVGDVVAAYAALLDPRVPPGAYNVASGVERRIGDLLARLMRAMGVRARIAVEAARARPATRSAGSALRLHRATGWAPRVALDAMLARVAADWRERISAR
jgi:GDP-4-dehydro-6-deoxy-D-mannose reductase